MSSKKKKQIRAFIFELPIESSCPKTDAETEECAIWSRSIGIYSKVEEAFAAVRAVLADKYEEILQAKMNEKEWRDSVDMPGFISELLHPDGRIRLEKRCSLGANSLIANWIATDGSKINRLITYRLIEID
jgi:hypothetical protein